MYKIKILASSIIIVGVEQLRYNTGKRVGKFSIMNRRISVRVHRGLVYICHRLDRCSGRSWHDNSTDCRADRSTPHRHRSGQTFDFVFGLEYVIVVVQRVFIGLNFVVVVGVNAVDTVGLRLLTVAFEFVAQKGWQGRSGRWLDWLFFAANRRRTLCSALFSLHFRKSLKFFRLMQILVILFPSIVLLYRYTLIDLLNA